MSTPIGGPGPVLRGVTATPPAAPGDVPFPLVEDDEGIRRFSDSRLQAAIDDALLALEPGKSVAVVAHHVYHNDGTAIENVTKLSLLVRLPAGFSVAAAAYKDWTSGELGAEGRVVWSPF